MSRCYCKYCKSEIKLNEGIWNSDICPICGNDNPEYGLVIIPDYETPEQYEKRTGKPYPDRGLVWCKSKVNNYHEYPDLHIRPGWYPLNYRLAVSCFEIYIVIRPMIENRREARNERRN